MDVYNFMFFIGNRVKTKDIVASEAASLNLSFYGVLAVLESKKQLID